jgi:hypothetical protein
MVASKRNLALGLAGLIWASTASAAGPEKLSGSIVGFVTDAAGIPQMGATVMLYNQYDRLLEKVLTNDKGAFGFDTLLPATYSVRVMLASFVPALKKIAVQPGTRSFLSINLAGVLSSIELIYNAPGQGPIMKDDWKWVLRSSMLTRPVLRYRPDIDLGDPDSTAHTRSSMAMFTGTRGMVRVSAGDSDRSLASDTPDLGTAFALATSLFGSNRLQFAGNVAYSSRAGLPAAGFRTSYSRGDSAASPEVQLTMRQMYLPMRAGNSFITASGTSPALRTMSLTLVDRIEIAENVRMVYGGTVESVSFLERLNYISPFARLTYSFGELGDLELAYSSGAPPIELMKHVDGLDEFHDDLAALASFPRVSLRAGTAQVQRAENFEIGYRRVAGSRTYSVGAYRERLSNAALTVAGHSGILPEGDLLPDLFSNSSIFNIGGYKMTGYMAAVTQNAADNLNITVAYGNSGVLQTDGRELTATNSSQELRSMIRAGRRNWASAKVGGTAPLTGTRFTTSYQWTDYRSLTPGHAYLTQRQSPLAGWNVSVRQPLPVMGSLPGRLEATAEVRNLLAQGYLTIANADGRSLLLVHSPRSMRGGFSFIF